MDAFWQNQQRIIQTNLQVQDTARIDPAALAAQIGDLGANVLVFNAGGIYAWYQSEVPFHHINEFLDPDRDLLAEVIEACHRRGIRVIGRFDFSRAEDRAYQAHPEWFVQDPQGNPLVVGSKRPGGWPLLYTVCMSSGYWREEMAVPVLTEALTRYDLDGVFFNGVYPSECHCDICRQRYQRMYGVPMPDGALDPSWRSRQIEENIGYLRDVIRKLRPEIPVVVYHWPEQSSYLSRPMEDLICDESQNVLSRGLVNLSPHWLPSYKMKICRLDSPKAPPCGIIHSSPGMDWRHTGLPPAEYRFWMSQIHTSGGSLWHSLTGIPDTISDKRLLEQVRLADQDIRASQERMRDMRPAKDLAVIFDPANLPENWLAAADPPRNWLTALFDRQIQFELLQVQRAAKELDSHPAVLVPEGIPITPELAQALCRYVRQGGRLMMEGKLPEHTPELFDLCGIRPFQKQTEYYVSSYLAPTSHWDRLEEAGLEKTPLIAFRGKVARSHVTDAKTLATLVPTFAPLDAVGAPPERASILTPQTDIPLCLEREQGNGRVIYLSFSLSHLIGEFGLGEHFLLADALFSRLIGERGIQVTHYPGLILNAHRGEDGMILHFINGVGRRPLSVLTPLYNMEVQVRVPGDRKPLRVVDLIGKTDLPFQPEGQGIRFVLPKLEAMGSVAVDWQ